MSAHALQRKHFCIFARSTNPLLMEELLKKLYYKGQKRIAAIEAPEIFYKQLSAHLPDIQADTFIDQRYLYDFMLVFVIRQDDVKHICPQVLHNLSPDGKLWIAFPKGTSKKYSSEISREKGWEPFEQADYKRVSLVSIDEDWSAMRLRNKKYIKSAKKEE